MAKKMYIGGTAKKQTNGLPMKYTQVEYIQSSGEQYFDTGVICDNSSTYVIEFACVPNGNAMSLMGCQMDSSTRTMSIWFDKNGYLCFTCGSASASSSSCKIEYTNGTRYDVVLTVNTSSKTVNATVNGTKLTQYTYSGTVNTSNSLHLLNNNGQSGQQFVGQFEYMKITKNGTLIRDYISCKENEIASVYDKVTGVFCKNIGSGSFTSGNVVPVETYEVDNVAREVKKMYVGANGVAREVTDGYIGVSGVARRFYQKAVPIDTFNVGDIVTMDVNGVETEFLIVHKGLPSSAYDSSCDGVWLLMKDCHADDSKWNSTDTNNYKKSTIHSYLNGTFLNYFDSDIQTLIKQVKIPYVNGTGSTTTVTSGANGLSTKIFLISYAELGVACSSYGCVAEGAVVEYFEGTGMYGDTKRIAYKNGSAKSWWARTPLKNDSRPCATNNSGRTERWNATQSLGVRPVLILPFDAMVSGTKVVAG
jgi:hypothetical protein